MNKKLWFSTQIDDIRFCFACGGGLVKRMVPEDGKKRLVCKICFHIFYVNPKSIAGLIPVLPDGRVVLLKRGIEPGRGKWSFPAGHHEMGESVEEAAMRETQEEILTRVKITKLIGVYSYADSGMVTAVYCGRVLKGEKPAAGHETEEVKFFKPENIPWSDLAFRSTVDALKDWVKQQ